MRQTKSNAFVVAGLCAVMLCACTQSFPAMDYDDENDGEISNTEPSSKVPVTLYVSDPAFFSISATRGLGAFGDTINQDVNLTDQQRYDKSLFYVYAFRDDTQETNDASVDMKVRAENDPEAEHCLVDGGGDKETGRVTKVNSQTFMMDFMQKNSDGSLRHVDIFYSTVNQKYGYNFFSYFIDDAKVESFKREHDRIYQDVVIDGTQDLLFGYADKLTEERVREEYIKKYGEHNVVDLELYNEEIGNIVAAGYSTFSAHRGFYPKIQLNHALARFEFIAYPGDEKANNMTIKQILVCTPSKLRMTVAANDLKDVNVDKVPDAKLDTLYVGEFRDGEYKDTLKTEYKVEFRPEDKDKYVFDRQSVNIGAGIMVLPEDTLRLVLVHDEVIPIKADDETVIGYDTLTVRTKYKVTLPPEQKFESGERNVIRIVVYGLQPIEMTASIAAWKPGDSVDVNPDDPDFEFE